MEAPRYPHVDDAVIQRAREILDRELETFRERTPRSAEWLVDAERRMPGGVPMAWMRSLYRHAPVVAVRGSGSRFEDLDGNVYVDFNACDLAMPAGFAPEPIVRAIHNQSLLGNHFLLPTTDAVEVCRLLSERFGLPQWQFTLSATGANTDAIRIARVATGRSTILVFDGKYHGHLDQTLWSRSDDGSMEGDLTGLDPSTSQTTDVLSYNDPEALRARLARGDVAAVVVESALTNCGLVLPTQEFVASLNTDVRAAGAVLIVDETHVQFAVHGGGTAVFGLEPDLLTGGKGIGGGVPIGVVGMTDAIAEVVCANRDHDPGLVERGRPCRAPVDHRSAWRSHPIPPHPACAPQRCGELRFARPSPSRRPQGIPAQPRHLGLHRHRRPLSVLRHRRIRRRHLRRSSRGLRARAHQLASLSRVVRPGRRPVARGLLPVDVVKRAATPEGLTLPLGSSR